MKHKKLVTDEGRERERGKGFREEFEDAFRVFGFAFALEAVHAVHVVGFVVAAVEEEGGWVKHFVGVEEEGDFGGPGAAVYEVAVEEEVVFFRGFAGEAEDFEEVEELAWGGVSSGSADIHEILFSVIARKANRRRELGRTHHAYLRTL